MTTVYEVIFLFAKLLKNTLWVSSTNADIHFYTNKHASTVSGYNCWCAWVGLFLRIAWMFLSRNCESESLETAASPLILSKLATRPQLTNHCQHNLHRKKQQTLKAGQGRASDNTFHIHLYTINSNCCFNAYYVQCLSTCNCGGCFLTCFLRVSEGI